MNARLVDDIANAVLYEGYILYPYRPSALKNRQRFNFGVLAPTGNGAAGASGEPSVLQTECLARGTWASVLDVRARGLQIVDRAVARLVEPVDGNRDGVPIYERLDSLEVDGTVLRGWQESVEREIRVTIPMSELRAASTRRDAEWLAAEDVEVLRAADGRAVGAIVRRKETVRCHLEVSGELLGDSLFKITVRVSNVTPLRAGAVMSVPYGRDAWLVDSLVSTHAILQIVDGEFLSLLDPPAETRQQAASCRQSGLWPVLVGDPADRDGLLASPIILYDHPQIAPESPGDFCDGTEIDEMLALRILTLTDDEKLEMRRGDERGRRMLERTENLSDEHLMRLHGVLRGRRSLEDQGAE